MLLLTTISSYSCKYKLERFRLALFKMKKYTLENSFQEFLLEYHYHSGLRIGIRATFHQTRLQVSIYVPSKLRSRAAGLEPPHSIFVLPHTAHDITLFFLRQIKNDQLAVTRRS